MQTRLTLLFFSYHFQAINFAFKNENKEDAATNSTSLHLEALPNIMMACRDVAEANRHHFTEVQLKQIFNGNTGNMFK